MNAVRTSSILVAFMMAAGCASSSSKMTEKAAIEIKGEEVEYTSGGTALKGYLAYNASQTGPRPGVLVVHEWWGHGDYARKRARMLAEMGYTAFALDMYGDGKYASHPKDAEKFMMEVFNDMDGGVERFKTAMELLKNHELTDGTRVAAIGYCFGGAVVLHMARLGTPLKGVASFHGNLSTLTPAQPDAVKASVLVAHGADDPLVPPKQVADFKAEMEAANVDLTFVEYLGAKHSFTNPAADGIAEKFGMPVAYNHGADEKSWMELDRFLKRVFASE